LEVKWGSLKRQYWGGRGSGKAGGDSATYGGHWEEARYVFGEGGSRRGREGWGAGRSEKGGLEGKGRRVKEEVIKEEGVAKKEGKIGVGGKMRGRRSPQKGRCAAEAGKAAGKTQEKGFERYKKKIVKCSLLGQLTMPCLSRILDKTGEYQISKRMRG